jgi:PAS domain S-box-containing protein
VVEHILGYSVEETHQFSVANLLDAEGIALMRQVIQTRLTGGQKEAITPVEYKMRHKDGRWVDVEVVSSAIFDPEGQLLGFVGVTRDITERKQAEEKMKQQLDELRRWHDLTLGRETRNLELKHEVNELLRRLNEPIRYPSAEA